jgi:hypothetical protein
VAAEALAARNLKTPYRAEPADSSNLLRRSVYMFHKRVVPYPLLAALDRPDATQSCGRRETTTAAPQALALLNDPFVRKTAGDFARRLERECGDDDSRQVERALALALSRPPSASEVAAGRAFLEAQRARRSGRAGGDSASDAAHQALVDFCQTVYSLNEFMYVD